MLVVLTVLLHELLELMFHNSFDIFYQPGTTVTTVTTAVTTVSADEGEEGILSSHDRSAIRNAWDQAKRDGDVPPQILFRFVQAHPEYQKMFSKFANVPQNELLSNGNFLAQAYTILAGLNVVIQSLSSQELMASQLNALGAAHALWLSSSMESPPRIKTHFQRPKVGSWKMKEGGGGGSKKSCLVHQSGRV
jgi:hypothetical protein